MVHSFFIVNKWPIWHPLITCSAATATVRQLFSGNTEYSIYFGLFEQKIVLNKKMDTTRTR